jgi:hypothetical protein
MTVIEAVQPTVSISKNEIRMAIDNNDPIEEFLHVIIVVSNPCNYKRRYQLALEFMERFKMEPRCKLYVVELAYGSQEFRLTDPENPSHLQLKTESAPLWHKENMINIGIRRLLPVDWKAVAWIDADIEFDSPTWATDTLKILNGSRDVVQLFSHAIDMDANEETMNIFTGFGFQYSKGLTWGTGTLWHPGFAWAMTRKAYDKLGGLYEKSILGAGDHNMALSFIGLGTRSINDLTTTAYKNSIQKFERAASGLRLGYTPGVVRHYFHGKKKNRKYSERWKILVKYAYDPENHVAYNSDGLIVPTAKCPPKLIKDILKYFKERNEDE